MRELQLACGPPAGPGAGGQGGARVAPAWGAAAGLGAGALVSGHGVAAPTCSAGSGLAHTCPLAPARPRPRAPCGNAVSLDVPEDMRCVSSDGCHPRGPLGGVRCVTRDSVRPQRRRGKSCRSLAPGLSRAGVEQPAGQHGHHHGSFCSSRRPWLGGHHRLPLSLGGGGGEADHHAEGFTATQTRRDTTRSSPGCGAPLPRAPLTVAWRRKAARAEPAPELGGLRIRGLGMGRRAGCLWQWAWTRIRGSGSPRVPTCDITAGQASARGGSSAYGLRAAAGTSARDARARGPHGCEPPRAAGAPPGSTPARAAERLAPRPSCRALWALAGPRGPASPPPPSPFSQRLESRPRPAGVQERVGPRPSRHMARALGGPRRTANRLQSQAVRCLP